MREEARQPVPRNRRAGVRTGGQDSLERIGNPIVERLALAQVLLMHLVHVAPGTVGVLAPRVARVTDVEDHAPPQFVLQVKAVTLEVRSRIVVAERGDVQARLRQQAVRRSRGLREAVRKRIAQQVYRDLPIRIQDPRSAAVVPRHGADGAVHDRLRVGHAESGAQHQFVRELVAQAHARCPVLGVEGAQVAVVRCREAEPSAQVDPGNLVVKRTGRLVVEIPLAVVPLGAAVLQFVAQA